MKRILLLVISFVMLLTLGACQSILADKTISEKGGEVLEKIVDTASETKQREEVSGRLKAFTEAGGDAAQLGRDYRFLMANGGIEPDNSKSLRDEETADSEYNIDVNLAEQRVRIYENGALIKEFIASAGIDQSTPTGDFKIQNRGDWFFSEKYQQGGKWWVSFKGWGVYLFHSVPMDSNQQIIREEADKLGSPASHGCIRLAVDDAKSIYDHIPQGTWVHIE